MAKLWLARWKNNSLHLYNNEPTKDDGFGEFWAFDGNINENSMHLDCDLFPEVTYENSPVEVKLETHDDLYISRSALIAELESRKKKYTKRGVESDATHDGYGMYWGGVLSCLNEIRQLCDTLEVKEVDLDSNG